MLVFARQDLLVFARVVLNSGKAGMSAHYEYGYSILSVASDVCSDVRVWRDGAPRGLHPGSDEVVGAVRWQGVMGSNHRHAGSEPAVLPLN